jgi:hypothetical protein
MIICCKLSISAFSLLFEGKPRIGLIVIIERFPIKEKISFSRWKSILFTSSKGEHSIRCTPIWSLQEHFCWSGAPCNVHYSRGNPQTKAAEINEIGICVSDEFGSVSLSRRAHTINLISSPRGSSRYKLQTRQASNMHLVCVSVCLEW